MRRDCLPAGLSQAFYHYGRFVARHPWPFLLTPLVLSTALVLGMMRMNSTSDLEYLYVPVNAPGKDERRRVENTFLYDEDSYFSSLRRTRLGGLVRLLVQDPDGGNMFDDAHIRALLTVNEYIKNITVTHQNSEVGYTDVCAHWQGVCSDVENTFLSYMDGKLVDDVDLTFPVHYRGASEGPMALSGQIGKPQLDAEGFVRSFEAVALLYSVKFDRETHRDQSIAWARKFATKMLNYDSQLLDVNVETFETIEQELEMAIFEVVPLFTITFMILGSFAFVSLLMCDWVRGKPFIASAGMIAACLGAGSGMGMLILCGVPFTTAIGAVPFLIIGIGMDDMYILVSAWRCTSYTLDTEERVGVMLRHSAVSITITSITDALAFGIGCITPFRSVQLFCAYTMIGVVFCYFYQLTFTLACITFSGRSEKANRHCITFRKILPKSEAKTRSKAYQLLCTGGTSADDKPPEEQTLTSPDEAIKLPYLNHFLGTTFAIFILKPPIKCIILMVYFLYLGFAIYGITQLKEGLDRANLVPDTSQYVRFLRDYDKFFQYKYGPSIMLVYDEPLNYTDSSVREEIRYNRENFRRNKYFFDDDETVVSWLDNYELYLSMTSRDITTMSETEFVDILRNQFLATPGFDQHLSDITFNNRNTTIVASRIFIQAKGPKDAVDERETMTSSREIALDCRYNAYTYHVAFTYFDQYTVILQNTLQNLGIATGCMLVVALIFIPSLSTVLWVTLTTLSIEVGVVGYMVFWNVNLDSISMINLIMCIGFSVDFAAHISYHYAISPSLSATKSAQEALGQLGAPIIQSALSTILSVAVLSISVSYIFRTFFKITTMVMLFGSFHALFLLPVLLSTIKLYFGQPSSSAEEVNVASQTEQNGVKRQHATANNTGPSIEALVVQTQNGVRHRESMSNTESNTVDIFVQEQNTTPHQQDTKGSNTSDMNIKLEIFIK